MHTPGPWHRIDLIVYALSDGGVNRFDARVSPGHIPHYDDDETQIANAQLIAAAPDLLDALEELLKVSEQLNDLAGKAAKSKARQALAKAKGEE